MKYEDFHVEEPILSPQKEVELQAKVTTLQGELAAAKTELAAQRAELARKDEIIALLQKTVYGQRSEKTEYLHQDDGQLRPVQRGGAGGEPEGAGSGAARRGVLPYPQAQAHP